MRRHGRSELDLIIKLDKERSRARHHEEGGERNSESRCRYHKDVSHKHGVPTVKGKDCTSQSGFMRSGLQGYKLPLDYDHLHDKSNFRLPFQPGRVEKEIRKKFDLLYAKILRWSARAVRDARFRKCPTMDPRI